MLRKRTIAGVAIATVAGATLIAGAATAGQNLHLTDVPHSNTKAPGLTSPNILSPELVDVVRAQGSMPLENPRDGVGYYGYDSVNNNPSLMPTRPDQIEAHKTEPDKNTYLQLKDQTGPDKKYNYGTHFLFQGHEAGSPGYVTRVNLDADPEHRVTLMATQDEDGKPLPDFDGSTWDPFAKKLLFTAEKGCAGGVWQGDATYSADGALEDISGAVGRGGYEGVQTASDGSLWLVEDVGGAKAGDNGKAKVANSYVYRFIPSQKNDLTAGKLQALQVKKASGVPMNTKAEPFGADLKDLHTYGKSFSTTWVTIHDTTTDGTTPFCATDAAAAKNATAFKRPENGVFRPGTKFGEFYFTETGDTNSTSPANSQHGGWGGVFRLSQDGPSANTGTLSLALLGDEKHTGFDNVSFASKTQLLVVEDAGDGLHSQRSALDSGYLVDVTTKQPKPIRFLAEGRDPSATIDSAKLDAGTPRFNNDGDNEITGIHVSDGDPTIDGLLGAKAPDLFSDSWRVFWTQQHGDNVTYELMNAGQR